MSKYIKWIVYGNRPLFFLIGVIVACTLGFWSAIAIALVLELEKWFLKGHSGGIVGWIKGDDFDWLSILLAVIGGGIGVVLTHLQEFFL